jgi:disease resistance protein RPM1
MDNTKIFLELIPLSTKLGLLEMLDLEDCKQLKDRHLKNICNHVFQLKYLSLRNTNITKLRKQLNKLKYQLLTFEIQRYELFPGRPFYFQS